MIKLIVEPRKVYSWEEFKVEKPPYSIALDGCVDAPTQREPEGPYANFDHHQGVDRQSTRSTSEQIHMEINMGLFDTFRKHGMPTATVFVNDPDEDTCLAYWLLKNNKQVVGHATPLINRLVYLEDRLDTTAGAYQFGDITARRELAWIFEPYNDARFAGRVAEMDESEMRSVIKAVEQRITQYAIGRGKELPLTGQYERIGEGTGWVFTRETGPASRLAMYNEGVQAFASLVAERDDGNNVVVLGRRSVWTPFPIPRIVERLNEEDTVDITEGNRWGGDTIGGSPRETGTALTIQELQDILEEEVRKYLKQRR